MQLGGRIFDDLFFQWFLDTNPAVLEAIQRDNDEHFVHWYLCREAKEHFSRTMAQRRYGPATKAIGNYGGLTKMTWEDFLGRGKTYQPSEQFREMLTLRGEASERLAADNCINVFDWFRTLLDEGLKKYHIHASDVQQVILTGGSSQWPFVREIVHELLPIDDSRVFQSPNPNSTIGTGLAVWPAVIQGFLTKSLKLRDSIPHFVNDRVTPALDECANCTIDAISQDVDAQLCNGTMKSILKDLAEHGGRVVEVEARLAEGVRAFQPTLEGIIVHHIQTLNGAMSHRIDRLVKEWLEDNGLPTATFRSSLGASSLLHPATFELQLPNPWLRVGCAAIGLLCVIVGFVLDGFVGALIAVVLLVVLLAVVGKRLRSWSKACFVPADLPFGGKKFPIARWFFRAENRDRLVSEGRDRFRNGIEREFHDLMQKPKSEASRAVEDLVARFQHIGTT